MMICLFSDALKSKIHLEYLMVGKIICHPTTSCYGLGCDIMFKESIEKIYAIKKRAINKPFNLLVQSYAQFKKYGVFDSRIEEYMSRYPAITFTFVVKRKSQLPNFVNPGYDTVGIQIAKGVLKELFSKYPNPIIGTSANMSNKELCYNIDSVKKQLGKNAKMIDLMIDKDALPIKETSTILRMEKKEVKILRGMLV